MHQNFTVFSIAGVCHTVTSRSL